MDRMPALFVGHGNPMNAIQDTSWSRAWRAMADDLPRPEAILAVSAHWYVPGTHLMGNAHPETIHDFGGFPPELYQVQYPAPGAPELAQRTAKALAPWRASVRDDWGLDHGTWSVVRHMYPKADVPVVQLSIDGRADAATHWAIGEALAPLRDEGVLILGSGNLVHNLRDAFRKWRAGILEPEPQSVEFDEHMASTLQRHDRQALLDALRSDNGAYAHPTPDHFLPILYAAGAAAGEDVSFPVEGFDMGEVSMRCVRFG